MPSRCQASSGFQPLLEVLGRPAEAVDKAQVDVGGHVVAEDVLAPPRADAPAGGLPPGRTVLIFTLVHTDGGWLAATATNTLIAALPTAVPGQS
jgi:hypothetical protein